VVGGRRPLSPSQITPTPYSPARPQAPDAFGAPRFLTSTGALVGGLLGTNLLSFGPACPPFNGHPCEPDAVPGEAGGPYGPGAWPFPTPFYAHVARVDLLYGSYMKPLMTE